MKLNFSKNINELVPAIVQDATTKNVLMLGYMNKESLSITQKTGKVTFYSRSKQRLWTKGETSGNFLQLIDIKADCDNDALLIQANPQGPTCHEGYDTCWGEENKSNFGFFSKLEKTISKRKIDNQDDSYVASLFRKGINKIAQKVGEEAIETIIEAKDDNKKLFLNESADLIFHYLILLKAKGFSLNDIEDVLLRRKT
jgi:phosphoribosyl-ATP pyrophosphohydrolase/phosphoribosyl-AMP cyclohydrolase